MDSSIEASSLPLEAEEKTPSQQWAALFKAAVDWQVSNVEGPADTARKYAIVKKAFITKLEKYDKNVAALYDGWMTGENPTPPNAKAHTELLNFLREKKEIVLPASLEVKGDDFKAKVSDLCNKIGSFKNQTFNNTQKKVVFNAINLLLKDSDKGLPELNTDNITTSKIKPLIEQAIKQKYPEAVGDITVFVKAIRAQVHENFEQYKALIDEMGDIYSSISRPSWSARARTNGTTEAEVFQTADGAKVQADSGSRSFAPAETQLLNTLRVDVDEAQYDKLTGFKLDKLLDEVLEKTKNPAQYLECYIFKYYGKETAKKEIADITGVPPTTFRHWREQRALPDQESLNTIKKSIFFKSPGDGEHFEQMVNNSRRELMTYALHRSDYDRFGQQLSHLSPSFACKELMDALDKMPDAQAAWKTNSFEGEGSLIATQGIFLHFLRKTLKISKQELQAIANLHTIRNIESDRKSTEANRDSRNEEKSTDLYENSNSGIGIKESIRYKLFTYYLSALETLAQKVDNCKDTDYERACAAKDLLVALRDSEVRTWVGKLPMSRTKRAREGGARVWTEIAEKKPGEDIQPTLR